MKLITLSLFIFIFCSCNQVAKKDTKVEREEIKNGDYTEHYDNGQIRSRRVYENNLTVELKTWYENGNRKSETKIDTIRWWYENGQLKKTSFFISDSTCKNSEYHNNGKVSETGVLLNSVRHGIWVEYFENGQMESKGEYVPCKTSEEGNIKSSYCHQGLWTYWHKNGQIKTFGNYVVVSNGAVRKGEWKEWNEAGHLNFIANYDSLGILDGEYQWWYSENNLGYKGNYKNGGKDGNWLTVNEHTKEKFIEVYRNDSLIEKKTFAKHLNSTVPQ